MGLCIVEFNEKFQDIASTEKDTFWFSLPPPTPLTLIMLLITFSWSSLNCSVAMSVTASTNNSNWLNFYRQLDKGRFPAMWIFTMKMLSLLGSACLGSKWSELILKHQYFRQHSSPCVWQKAIVGAEGILYKGDVQRGAEEETWAVIRPKAALNLFHQSCYIQVLWPAIKSVSLSQRDQGSRHHVKLIWHSYYLITNCENLLLEHILFLSWKKWTTSLIVVLFASQWHHWISGYKDPSWIRCCLVVMENHLHLLTFTHLNRCSQTRPDVF